VDEVPVAVKRALVAGGFDVEKINAGALRVRQDQRLAVRRQGQACQPSLADQGKPTARSRAFQVAHIDDNPSFGGFVQTPQTFSPL
jgi:hypothetical protein